ncbi:hypothetical protein N3K66_005953 [Trichothecium roseum]|uniref:Uncharacterized protein n=1 Tax=Trichothecium roseum TaxID=47278 RepID=A0ACC0V164_9HYPO|nr:hypothetical protein N3K66_005953 [Trichothecium roseum]
MTGSTQAARAHSRVAIIGTGLAGLATAHLLQRDNKHRYAVTLFEQADGLSFDGASVAIKNEKTGDIERIDLPMRAVAGGYYANLMRIDIVNYKRLSHGQQHYAVCGGVSQVQTKLAEGLGDVRLGARVVQVIPQGDDGQVVVRWQSMKSGQVEEERFDRAVLAISPDVAARMFAPLSQALCDIPTITVESCVLSEGSETHQTVTVPTKARADRSPAYDA